MQNPHPDSRPHSPPGSWPTLRSVLRERLLRAGIAPRHVRRYLGELTDHFHDLCAEEQRTGLASPEAEAAALARLGTLHTLTDAMTSQPELRAWSARAPSLAFSLAPLLALAVIYLVACSILWSGWHLFLADHGTPFVPVDGVAIPYFGVGRLLYFTGPVLVGWAVAFVGGRQRVNPRWPTAAFLLLAVAGAIAQIRVHAEPTGVASHPWVLHVGMGLDWVNEPGFSGHALAYNLATHGVVHFLVIFALSVLPFLVLRVALPRRASA